MDWTLIQFSLGNQIQIATLLGKRRGRVVFIKKSFDSLAEEEAQVGLSYEDLEFAEEMAILPMTPFFENPRNYEYNYQFIKRNGEVAKSAAEAHDWVTSGAKVEFQVLDYVKRWLVDPKCMTKT